LIQQNMAEKSGQSPDGGEDIFGGGGSKVNSGKFKTGPFDQKKKKEMRKKRCKDGTKVSR